MRQPCPALSRPMASPLPHLLVLKIQTFPRGSKFRHLRPIIICYDFQMTRIYSQLVLQKAR